MERAAEALRGGLLVAFPTETVYGLGAAPDRAEAVRRLHEVKSRPEGKPFQLLVADMEAARRAGGVFSAGAERIARKFWPGPLTIVVPKMPDLRPGVAKEKSGRSPPAEEKTIGLRVPDHAAALELIRLAGGALLATSANRAGAPEPRTAQEAADGIGDAAAIILDGGPVRIGKASTVARAHEDGRIEVLREGAISGEELERAARG
jgi:L-threonylcarbamoyladenylate synthase